LSKLDGSLDRLLLAVWKIRDRLLP